MADAEALGVRIVTRDGTPVAVPEDAPPPAPPRFAVLRQFKPAVDLFLAMETQWRWTTVGTGAFGMGGGAMTMQPVRTALDYAALPAVAGALRLDLDATLLSRLRAIEYGALDEFAVMAKKTD